MKGWRTVFFNVAAALPLLIDQVAAMLMSGDLVALLAGGDRAGALPPGWAQWYTLAVIGANLYLRTQTTTPLGRGQ